MKRKDPALWAALRLHRILSQRRRHPHGDPFSYLAGVLTEHQSVERHWRQYGTARRRGWTHAADVVFRRLIRSIERLHLASADIAPPRIAAVPTVTDILAEINHLDDEFDDVEILPDDKRIGVTTDEITLEGVRLGAFAIRLDFEALSKRVDSSVFVIQARNANPAAGKSCVHPHVSDKQLCAGDATAPISCALAEGRIGDAFQLVNRVLHTYNPTSAYVALEDWDGHACSDCGFTASGDSLRFCDFCQKDFCDDCMQVCESCGMSVCRDCSQENKAGDRFCPKCKEAKDQEEEADIEEEIEAAVSDDVVHDPAEEQPQPQAEISHAHSHFRDIPDPQPAGLPGGTTDGETGAVANEAGELHAA